jgi:gluconokinase
MGVAGCGKSTLAALLAPRLGVPMIEGDDHHSAASIEKMRRGIPLDDSDRMGWLERLCEQLRRHEHGAVLSCSALKRAYRERLRATQPQLHFVYLNIDREAAFARVGARGGSHSFPATLIDSQFLVLEPPEGEPAVLRAEATRSPAAVLDEVLAWLPRA